MSIEFMFVCGWLFLGFSAWVVTVIKQKKTHPEKSDYEAMGPLLAIFIVMGPTAWVVALGEN